MLLIAPMLSSIVRYLLKNMESKEVHWPEVDCNCCPKIIQTVCFHKITDQTDLSDGCV